MNRKGYKNLPVDCSGCGQKNIPRGCVKTSGLFFCDIPCYQLWLGLRARKCEAYLLPNSSVQVVFFLDHIIQRFDPYQSVEAAAPDMDKWLKHRFEEEA